MKKTFFILVGMVLLTGFGCRAEESIENDLIDEIQPSSNQTFESNDCPDLLEGWDTKESSRFIGIYDTNDTKPPQLFDNGTSWGLRCRYYHPKAENFEIEHAEGISTGDFQYHYELEIRRFSNPSEQDNFYKHTVTDMINSYCRTDNQLVMPLLLKNDALNERYQCTWPAEKSDGEFSQVNTNTLLSITKYEDAIIQIAIVKESGQMTFIPPDYSAISDNYEEHAFNAVLHVFEDINFIALPDKHEQYLIDHAISIIDDLLQ